MTLDKFEEPVLYKIGDNRTLSESDKMADFGTQPCLNCTVPEGENGQDSVCSETSRATDLTLMHLLRCVHFYSATLQFNYTATHIHIAEKLDTAADALCQGTVCHCFILFSPKQTSTHQQCLRQYVLWCSKGSK